MAASIPALVEPLVLRWARESVGLSPLAAARRLGVPDDRVESWEQGATQPSIAQLRKAAAVYKRPLGVFFLAQPPQDFDAMRDFRRHVDAAGGQWSPELHGEFRRAQLQRENALELFELEDNQPPTTWRIDDLPADTEAAGALARARLLAHAVIPLPSGGVGTSYDHLNAWTAALEEAGVLVLATSRGGVSPSEMRAFSLYFDEIPIIVANGADGARGRLFSMLHEYAHLVLHTAGLCDTVTDARATNPDRELEARCNAIAAAILMPAGDVLAQPLVTAQAYRPEEWTYDDLRIAAAPFGVSAEAFLRRLATLGRTSQTFYQRRREEYLAAYEEDEARTKAGGGNWYRNTARDLGKGYVRRIADAYRRRVIDSYTAASYLNVKVGQIPRLAQEAALQVSAQR
jgi:Zn-dependent peptidase ImmA (M78 family)/transcriptional regulator with XRE-family HTH domain